MFSENTAYVKLDEKPESLQTEEQPSITPLVEPSVEEIPTEELKDEHEQYLIKEDIKESEEITEDPPLDETEQAEPITPILDSTAETTANKCVMTCSVM